MTSEARGFERRCSKRVAWRCQARLLPLSLRPRAPVPGLFEAVSRDISEGGLQIRCDHPFALKTRLLVEMESPELPEGIQAVGSVAWISPTDTGRHWRLGIEFFDVGDITLTNIRGLRLHEQQPERDSG